MQVDKPTKLLNTCVCGRKPDHYTIGYSRTPFYVGCVCGRLVDGPVRVETLAVKAIDLVFGCASDESERGKGEENKQT